MNITGRMIGSTYYEAKVDDIETGTLDKNEALEFAHKLLLEAEQIAYWFQEKHASDAIGNAAEELRVRFECV
mgnify:FL=1